LEIAFESPETQLQKLRERLRLMSDDEMVSEAFSNTSIAVRAFHITDCPCNTARRQRFLFAAIFGILEPSSVQVQQKSRTQRRRGRGFSL
jgi:hypothetical protein